MSSTESDAQTIKVLFVEDSVQDVELILRQLRKGNYNPQYQRVASREELIKALHDSEWEIVLSDYHMPGFSGREANEIVKASGKKVPFVVVSGAIGEEIAVEMMRTGAADFVMKDNLSRLAAVVDRELREASAARETRELYESLVNSIPQLAWMADETGSIYWYNDRWYEYTGSTPEDVQGLNWSKVHHPDHVQLVLSFMKDAWAKEEPFEITFPLKSRTGEYRWFLTRAVPIKNSKGTLLRWFGTNTDVDEQLRTSAELSANRNQLHAIIQNMEEGLILADKNGKVLLFNPSAFRLHGLKENFHINKRLDEFTDLFEFRTLSGEVLSMENRPLSRVLRGERLNEFEVQVVRIDEGSSWFASYSGSTVMDDNGEVALAVLTVRDVTERIQTEKNLKEAVTARDEFLSIASHELKTPLTSLTIQFQLQKRLLDRKDPKALSFERVFHVTEQAERLSLRLNRLVEDMLDISRISSGNLSIQRSHVDLCHLVSEVINRMIPQFNSVGFERPEFSGKELKGNWDPLRIEQVINNLLTNAMRYGKGKPVSIKVYPIEGHARISVTDQGMGISPEDQIKIFNRFERAVSSNEVSGLGLGLYISEQIIKAHGGRIWVDSKLGQGSTFYVDLPLSNCHT